MTLAALLPNTPGLLVEQVILGEKIITLVARLATAVACCSCYAQPSSRVHSCTRRTLLDLPISDRQVHLSLQVRRFRCGAPTCPRRTFRERVPIPLAPAGAVSFLSSGSLNALALRGARLGPTSFLSAYSNASSPRGA